MTNKPIGADWICKKCGAVNPQAISKCWRCESLKNNLPKDLPVMNNRELCKVFSGIDNPLISDYAIGQYLDSPEVKRLRKVLLVKHNTDQLLYDALWEENERLEKRIEELEDSRNMLEQKYVDTVDKSELAKVRQDMAREIFREIDEHRRANALHGIPIISEEWLQSLKFKYGGA